MAQALAGRDVKKRHIFVATAGRVFQDAARFSFRATTPTKTTTTKRMSTPATPLSQVLTMANDFPIVRVQGTLTSIYQEKTGTTEKGPWSIQNATLTDASGTSIQLFIKDKVIPTGWKGREIELQAHKGERGWTGVYAFDDTYKDETRRKIKVTSTAIVSLLDGSGQQATTEQAKAANAPAPQQPTTQRQQSAPTGTTDPVRDVRAAAMQVANLQLLCLTAVETYVAPEFQKRTGKDLSPEDRHAWAMNMAIQLQRENQAWKMPTHAMKATAAPAQPAAAPAPAPEPPKPTPPPAPASKPYDQEPGETDQDIPF